jgi:hypothetical protein
MKVGDLVSCNMFAGPDVDDIGVIVSIMEKEFLYGKVRIAWLREPRVVVYYRNVIEQDMALGVLSILRHS